MREIALLLCLHLAFAVEFFNVGGQAKKRADPCNFLLYRPQTRPGGQVDCWSNQMPPNAVTMLVPTDLESLGWVSAALYPFTNAAITALPVTMTLAVDEPQITAATVPLRLSSNEGRCGFTDAAVPAVVGTVAAGGKSFTFNVPQAWRTLEMDVVGTPRSICVDLAGNGVFVYTGVKLRVVTGCNSDNLCVAHTSAAQPFRYRFILNDTLLARKTAKNKCCGNSLSFTGECINPNAETCCSGISYNPSVTKCCREATEMIQWNQAPCPCWRSTSSNDCALLQQTCCLPTKYSELSTDTTQRGECYNTTVHKCCETGHIYQAGVEQCCVVNGLQSVDIPCPCEQDAHCKASGLTSTEQGNFICCKQTTPALYETNFNTTVASSGTLAACSTYSMFPLGFGPAQSARCPGICINSQYQVCCNGVACIDKYERCCNATCCNKFVSACVKSRRAGVVGQWHNDNDFSTIFDVCSTIEQMETVKAFWVFVWPALLMLMTFLGLALTLGYASHANRHAIVDYMWIERFMIFLGILSSLFSIPLFFAPLYKYGTLVVIISLFAIVTAASRVEWLNLVCVVLQAVLLIYLFDPFHGNSYFTLAMDRTSSGGADNWSMGVLHSTWRMWPSLSDVQSTAFCTNYFNFFKFDMNARDTERFENPLVPTFGYCSRGFVEALYLFEGGILVTVLLQCLVDLIAVVFRFKDYMMDPLYLELHGKQL